MRINSENILLAFSIVLSICILSFSILIFIKANKGEQKPINENNLSLDLSNENVISETTKEEEEEIAIIEVEDYSLSHSAWIPAWDFTNGFKSLEKNRELITTVSPVLYGVNNDGTLVNRKPEEKMLKELLSYCNLNNVRVIPTIASMNIRVMQSLFTSDTYTQKHIELIMEEVRKYNFDGIDIDYEQIRGSEKEGYLSFLGQLGNELGKLDKVLIVTVIAKTRDGGEDTLEAQDWYRIGQIADEVRIMAYDYTLQSSRRAGPIGPLPWIKEVMTYALKNIENDKIVLGVHLYAYLWKEDKASALTKNGVLKIINNPRVQEEYREDIAEGFADYTCSDGSRCILYYQTKQGVAERISLAESYQIKGLSYWRLGGEEDLLQQNP
jgi:spore germination protein